MQAKINELETMVTEAGLTPRCNNLRKQVALRSHRMLLRQEKPMPNDKIAAIDARLVELDEEGLYDAYGKREKATAAKEAAITNALQQVREIESQRDVPEMQQHDNIQDLPPVPPIESYEGCRATSPVLDDMFEGLGGLFEEATSTGERATETEQGVESHARLSGVTKKPSQAPKPVPSLDERTGMLNEQQMSAFEDMRAGKNVFLSGEGGTGKSFVSEVFIEWCRVNRKRLVVSAPTGVAALNVGGITNHRAFSLPFDFIANSYESRTKEKTRDALAAADIILIDEIGMVRGDMFSHIEYKCSQFVDTRRPELSGMAWGGKQIIVVGDFFQLQPVVAPDKVYSHEKLLRQAIINTYGGVYAFQTQAWKNANFSSHVLTFNERFKNGTESAAYTQAVNQIREGDTRALGYLNDNSARLVGNEEDPVITFTNATADSINTKRLESLEGQVYQYAEQTTGDFKDGDRIAAANLVLKVGARVMCLVNNPQEGYVNGTIGIVRNIDFGVFPGKDDSITIECVESGDSIEVKPYTVDVEELGTDKKGNPTTDKIGSITQFPIRLAWACTAHKMQGKTLDRAILMMDGKYRQCGQFYVALSRVKSIAGLTLFRDIYPTDVKCDPAVTQFYRKITGGKMFTEYDPRLMTLIEGLKELAELDPPDGALQWINDRVTHAITEMNQRRMK